MTDIQMNREVDTELIKKVVAGVEAAFNKHDIDEFDSYYTSNSVRVNAFGKKLTGFPEANEGYKHLLTGPLRDSYAVHKVENILFVGSDVAVVHINQKPTTVEGNLIEDGQGSIGMCVMIKADNNWKIIAYQGTLVKN